MQAKAACKVLGQDANGQQTHRDPLERFLKSMNAPNAHGPPNLAIVLAPCFLRHDDVNVFMANRDFEIEFTRRVIAYAGGEDQTMLPCINAIGTASKKRHNDLPIIINVAITVADFDGVLQIPDLTPHLNHAKPARPLTTESSSA